MAANIYIILIQMPGEKVILFMKRKIFFITLAYNNICDLIHNFLVDFVSKECYGEFFYSLL